MPPPMLAGFGDSDDDDDGDGLGVLPPGGDPMATTLGGDMNAFMLSQVTWRTAHTL